MKDNSSPLCSTYLYQDEGIEELRHCVLYISELEATIVATKDEITRREFVILNLKNILTQTIQERNGAQQESKKLFLEKTAILQQQQVQHQEQETRNSESEAESESEKKRLLSEVEMELPEKGKLLQAVKEAGPLLNTLLLAGPLPQWHQPPPNLHDSNIHHIPPPIFTNKRSFDSSFSPPIVNKYKKVSLF